MEDQELSQSGAPANQPADNSLLGKVLLETESQERNAARPVKLISNILSGLRSREREVLLARYGLISEKDFRETLESIGQKFGVTRERVRQIENAALKKIGKKYANQLRPLLKIVGSYLSGHGGVAEMEELAKHLNLGQGTTEAELDRRALRLIMGTYDKVRLVKKYPLFKEGWAMATLSPEDLLKVQTAVHQLLEQAGQALNESELTREISQQLAGIDPALVSGILTLDPKVSLDNKGRWGLTAWPSVVPRRIRDKACLVLEEAGQPLHFEKITQLISEKYSSEKKVLNRTVHNELIGDPRFVLVGRGIYALGKWGYKPGVVADVIKEAIMKAGRPLMVLEIIAEVLKSRQVKKNTIIANLQNRQLFRKVAKSTYALAESAPGTVTTNSPTN